MKTIPLTRGLEAIVDDADFEKFGHHIPKPCTNTSGFKGVKWHKRAKKWEATIRFNKTEIYLGLSPSIIESARRYDEASAQLHKEFGSPNFYDHTRII